MIDLLRGLSCCFVVRCSWLSRPAAHHLARSRADRDAVRDRRRSAGRRRQQLRRVSAGGEGAADGRRAARSRHRAHHLAQARSRHHLRQPGRPADADEARVDSELRLPARRPRRTSLVTMRELGQRTGHVGRGEQRGARASKPRSPRCGPAWPASRGRARCWSSAASPDAAEHLRQRRHAASCTTCSRSPAATTSSHDIDKESVAGVHRDHPDARGPR